jgi:hypothetical protein
MVNLGRAQIGVLVDDRESWPQILYLDGLAYSDLTYMPARERLEWLNRSVGYLPQPYEQLAGHYRQLGHDDQARRVLLSQAAQTHAAASLVGTLVGVAAGHARRVRVCAWPCPTVACRRLRCRMAGIQLLSTGAHWSGPPPCF